jgi:surface antigen
MSTRRFVLAGVPAFALALGALAPPASAIAGHPAATKAARDCGNPSHASTDPSRFNRTPKGADPWQVPLDECNTEGAGASTTPYYNCAYWAAEKRPDVWVNAVLLYGYSSKRPGAWRIPVDAQKAGYRVDHHPVVGDIAAWGRNDQMGTTSGGTTYTASPGGHVAYVEHVRPHGRITISSMGQGATGGYTTTIKFNKKHTRFIHAES